VEEAHNFVPGSGEEKKSTPSLATIRKLLTEGRKFGTGVILISQRPNRLDETTLAQCNSFLILKLVNPKDQRWVQSVMEQMSDQDKNALKAFANGQAFISGHAVKFPLQVQVKRDIELETSIIGDEDFMEENERNHKKNKDTKEKKSKNSDQIDKIMTAAAKTKKKF
jgi:DNA helicase HerA-like ATPase